MCSPPDDNERRVQAQAELLEGAARLLLATQGHDADHIEAANYVVNNAAYDLEHKSKPNIKESNED